MKDVAGEWVLVADASRARVFERGSGGLREIADFLHSESRLRNQELDADRPGRSFGVGPTHHGLSQAHDAHSTEAIRFAGELAEYLDATRTRHEFKTLTLVAPAPMLGRLRAALPLAVAALVGLEVVKNLVRDDPHTIEAALERA
jgi:protein required for attachment to host cells